MTLQIVEKLGTALERILIYGAPKVGKTRLATSLPWGPYWGEKAILVTADMPRAEGMSAEDAAASSLKPVLDANRERLLVVVPDGTPNWMEEAVAIARAKYDQPGVRTIIWDTLTETAKRILRFYSDTGVFSDKHAVQVGSRALKSWHTSPMEGDYGAAQNTIAFLQEHLWSQPLHLIVIFHEDFIEPESGSIEGLIGGPATVGKKAIRWIPAKYDTVLYMQRRMATTEKSEIIVNTVQRGIWVAGVRGTTEVPAQIVLRPDPTHVWRQLRGEPTAPLVEVPKGWNRAGA